MTDTTATTVTPAAVGPTGRPDGLYVAADRSAEDDRLEAIADLKPALKGVPHLLWVFRPDLLAEPPLLADRAAMAAKVMKPLVPIRLMYGDWPTDPVGMRIFDAVCRADAAEIEYDLVYRTPGPDGYIQVCCTSMRRSLRVVARAYRLAVMGRRMR